jgi:hypothetical protein
MFNSIIEDHDATTDITDAAVDKAYYSPARIGHVKIHWEGIEGGFDGIISIWGGTQLGLTKVAEIVVDTASNTDNLDAKQIYAGYEMLVVKYDPGTISGASAKLDVGINLV